MSIDDIETFAAELPDSFLRCRRWGHAWEPRTVIYDRKARTYDETTQCLRCETQRTTVLASNGDIVKVRPYAYPDGYVSHGLGRFDTSARSVVRAELMGRMSTGPRAVRRKRA